jgi:hypothetical protein
MMTKAAPAGIPEGIKAAGNSYHFLRYKKSFNGRS